jgi:hypothetical protein
VITSVDTNVIVDVLSADAKFGQSSESALFAAARQGGLILGEAAYAELVPGFDDLDHLNDFIARSGLTFQPSNRTALFYAGEAWKKYLLNTDRTIQCPDCGARQDLTCESCGRPLRFRQHIISDFLIGGHALVHADRLLTRDPRYFRTYFPELALA